ncbi:hypothetical protein BXZ70DRAFT_454918 [Cristinia sonorae]|uniref:Uncharacterized protein n=1 Tax=Cristinia sonorae TaxID=1940300 RepID=A0A8K0UIZ8_9AGAR|nr:hypothetical protein BXZ70DRAFT_454918 [Cristinia sonorae]
MDNLDSPPSPLHSPPDSPARSRRSGEPKRQRSSKHLSSASKELAKLLVFEEKECQELRSTLQLMAERLKMETQRADEAESRVKDVVFRFKEANDARLAAQVESARYREELNLYKLQLDNAQKELRRAQELLDAVEAQRVTAEEEAARARGMARKLKEEKVIQVARDEGRKQGIEEGIARGRAMGYEEGRAAGYARGKTSATKEYMQKQQQYEPAEYDLPGSPIRISASTSDDSSPLKRPAPVPIQQPQGTPPEDIRIASPGSNNVQVHAAAESRSNPRSSVHSFTQITSDYPQDDGWIPKIDEDGRVRLPPPHELASSPVPSPPAPTPPLMVPPPVVSQPTNSDSDVTTPTEPTSGRPRYRRRRSTESNSTTMSQFDILGPPVASSGPDRAHVLSAIAEEKERSSTVSSPQGIGSSPYAYQSSPNLAMPVARPGPEHPATPSQAASENYYVRPRFDSSSEAGHHPGSRTPPDRSQSRSTPSLKGSIASNAGFNISVEPPSRPDSHASQQDGTQQEPHLLTPEAAHRPLPDDHSAPQDQPSFIAPQPTGSSLSALGLPLQLPSDGQLPPGFVPMGPPQPTSHTPVVIPNLGGIYTNPNTPAAVPLPPSAAPTAMYSLYSNPNTPAAVPLPPSAVPTVHRLNYTPSVAGSQIPRSEPGVVIPPTSSMPSRSNRYSRSALKDSSESSDDGSSVSSGMGSVDTLTTPPQRKKSFRRPPSTPYPTAPTPPDVTYPLPVPPPGHVPPTPMSMVSGPGTSYAARVPLPPSSVGVTSPTRSSLSVGGAGGGSTTRAARVPLPASSVGSPRSVYTRKGGSISGSVVGRG